MITVFIYELRRTLRSPWFYVTCFLLPAILLLSVKLPEFISNRVNTESKGVKIIISDTGVLGKFIVKELENDPFIDNWEIILSSDFRRSEKTEAKDKDIIYITEENGKITAKMRKRNEVYESVLKRAVKNAYFINMLSEKGMSRDEILKLKEGINLKFITKGDKKKKGQSKFIIMVFLVVFYVSIIGYGELLAHRIMADKENNFINILLLYKKPEQIFTGKLLSVVVGYLIYLLINFLLTLFTLRFILGKGINQFAVLFFNNGIDLNLLLLVFILFFVSFIMYSSFYLLSGALANNEEDLKGHSTIINFTLISSLIISTISISTPEIELEKLLFYIPPVTPFMLLKNILKEDISTFGITMGFFIVVSCTIVFIKLASSKYKTSSLYKRG